MLRLSKRGDENFLQQANGWTYSPRDIDESIDNTPINRRRLRPSTSKKSRGSTGTDSDSRNPQRFHTGLMDEESPPEKDGSFNFDLSHRCNLFETCLAGASTPTPSIPAQTNKLDLGVVCSPLQFQAEWQGLQKGLTLSHKIHLVPSLSR